MFENCFEADRRFFEQTEQAQCGESTFPPHVSLAMMYVPAQRFVNLYDDSKALERGTLFADLDLPFVGGKRCKR